MYGGENGEIFTNRSTHDSTIFRPSRLRTRFVAGEFDTGILLGYSRYPLKSYLLIPLVNPKTTAKQLYNESHIRTRNLVERPIGVGKRRFPCLSYGFRCKFGTGLVVIVAIAILHNRIMHDGDPPVLVGINMQEFDYYILQGKIPSTNPQE